MLDTGLPENISTDAFKDYEPQVVAMPRIAFSFPVSDKSEFKAPMISLLVDQVQVTGWQTMQVIYLWKEWMVHLLQILT